MIKPWWIRPNKVADLEDLMKELMDPRLQPDNREPFHYTPSPPVYELPSVGESGSERASPPLYEVELTASDEDDDASVLELVIPMQSSRYQRVPTSSPEKINPRAPKSKSFSRWLMYGLFCCLRRK